MNQRDRVALVTGANRGIGLEVAKQLEEQGNHHVVLGVRDISRGEEAAKTIASKGAKVLVTALDVTDQSSVEKVVRTILSNFGRLDILVNNAVILIDESDLPSETDLEIVRTTFETNLLGPWRLCKAFIPIMKENGYGRIVNVSSGMGLLGI